MGLGSNQGDSLALLQNARKALAALPGITLQDISPIYRTEPQGLKEQPWFFNQVVSLECCANWTARVLLHSLLEIETTFGRTREGKVKFGPRPLDLDLLLFGADIQQGAELTVPHPRMRDRAFVLVPLHDVAPDFVFPDGQSLKQALEALSFHVRKDEICQK